MIGRLIGSAASPTPSSSSSATAPGASGAKTSGPETTSMGSIADRMKALSGKGMDVGDSTRRMSKDLGTMAPPPVSAGLTRNGGTHATGGAGNYGPARTGASRPRALSRTEDKGQEEGNGQDDSAPKVPPIETKSRSRSSSLKESKPPISASSTSKRDSPPQDAKPVATSTTTSPSTSSHRPPPITAPKPKLPVPPSQSQAQAQPPSEQQPTNTGSSSSSTRAGDTGSKASVPTITPIPPSHSGPTPQSAKSAKPPLPPIPQQQPQDHEPSRSGPGPETANGLSDFERAFPSLDDFGKQFEEPPSAPPNGLAADEESRYAFPDVPSSSFPELPSVPKSKPGLPTPPNGSPPGRFGSLRPIDQADNRHDSPPNPDVDRDTKRPSSQPNLTKLDGRIDPSVLNSINSPEHTPPTLQDFRTPQPPSGSASASTPVPGSTATPIMSPQSTKSPPNGHGHGHDSSPIAFPTPQPTPAQRRSMPVPARGQAESMKPKFPFSNSVNCETLRSYFLNPDVEMILLDVRPEEEYKRGVVGAEYEPRGAKLRVVWMDPTVLMRNE